MQKNGILYIFIPYKREITLKVFSREIIFLNPSPSNVFKTVDQQIMYFITEQKENKQKSFGSFNFNIVCQWEAKSC